MKITRPSRRAGTAGFSLIELMISSTIVLLITSLAIGTSLFGLRMMYKDTERLQSNANLRTFISNITNKTVSSSFYYLFPYYTSLDGSVDLINDPSALTQIYNAANDTFDEYSAFGDCLVLVTKTSEFRTSDIRRVRIYYRVTTNQAGANADAALRYYETADWGEGNSTTSNGHPVSNLAATLNAINLSTSPLITGSKLVNSRTRGRLVPSPSTPYVAGDRYHIFSTLSPTASRTAGNISINVEFINGTTARNTISSSSFNYTISPRS